MIAQELISDSLPPLKQSDPASLALELMQEFGVDMLPVVNKEKYVGLITDEAILDIEDLDKPLTEAQFALTHPYVKAEMHLFEVIKIAVENNLNLIPVVGKDDQYLGLITLSSLVRSFSNYNGLLDPGAVLVLDINYNDYTVAEIARICESNDVKILCLYTNIIQDQNRVEVTLKLNKSDIGAVVNTFERFQYTIKASFQESEYMQDLKDRYDAFMRYMNT